MGLEAAWNVGWKEGGGAAAGAVNAGAAGFCSTSETATSLNCIVYHYMGNSK